MDFKLSSSTVIHLEKYANLSGKRYHRQNVLRILYRVPAGFLILVVKFAVFALSWGLKRGNLQAMLPLSICDGNLRYLHLHYGYPSFLDLSGKINEFSQTSMTMTDLEFSCVLPDSGRSGGKDSVVCWDSLFLWVKTARPTTTFSNTRQLRCELVG